MSLENQLNKKNTATGEKNAFDLQDEPLLRGLDKTESRKVPTERNLSRTIFIGGALLFVLWGVDQGRQAIFTGGNDTEQVIEDVVAGIEDGFNDSRYSEDLLKGMGDRMKEMGYGELSATELADLRDKGLTATWLGQIRNLGYNDLTLDDAIRLKDRDVSATFLSMMQGLGYTLSVDDIVRLKDAEVTANYTSKLADLGYKNLTIEELIRLKTAGVSVDLVEKLIKRAGGKLPTLEEIIRYRASNQ